MLASQPRLEDRSEMHMHPKSRSLLFILMCCGLASGCSNLPSSGPTAAEISDSVEENNAIGMRIVDLTPEVLGVLANHPAPTMSVLTGEDVALPPGAIGIGDALSVSVFEAGPGLFSSRPDSGLGPAAPDAATKNTTLPPLLVDGKGGITVPYAGRVEVAGLTPEDAAGRIEMALKGKSVQPQVVVNIVGRVANSVMVYGDVRAPGRYSLTLARERLLDVVALAGGSARGAQDTVITLSRQKQSVSLRLSDIYALSDDNMLLEAGDRVEVRSQPRTYMVFGATGRVSEISFDVPHLSLAQAVARSGGPSDSQADPRAVYLFRYEAADTAKSLGLTAADPPVIYRVDLMQPASYFAMEKFTMRDGDMIYIANASTNRLQKALNLFSALVSPAVVGKTLSP